MTKREIHEPFRTSGDAHRLHALGLHMADQVITPQARDRERRDEAFRADLAPLRELLRPHVFAGRDERDAACCSPMPGDVFALEAVQADEVSFRWRTPCLFAIGHGIDDPRFEEVASVIADPEIFDFVERSEIARGREGSGRACPIILTVSGAHYQFLIDEEGEPKVEAKIPFGVVSDEEVKRTATWFFERLCSAMDYGMEI